VELNAHDLLRINAAEDLQTDIPLPDWAIKSFEQAPYVVVRRADTKNGLIPVGIRGTQRGQRMAAWVQPGNVTEVIRPYMLTNPDCWKFNYDKNPPEAINSLKQLISVFEKTAINWGPTGSTAFELASGVKTLKDTSDLDLVLHIQNPLSQADARVMLDQLQKRSTVRLDIQLSTPLGGVSLAEYAGVDTVLVKTKNGPVLAKRSALWI